MDTATKTLATTHLKAENKIESNSQINPNHSIEQMAQQPSNQNTQNATIQSDVIYDVVVIGGGINGVGIAADAAGRGLKVLLCEQDDLAAHTSSASSKLIHGGLRYLEHMQFRLVREALAEREVLMNKAPHLIQAMRFVLPHRPHLRPAWLIRLGLFLYDHLGTRHQLPAAKRIRFKPSDPLHPHITNGFEYSDCWVDDARLVVGNALHAAQHGATIATRTKCSAATQHNGLWQVQLQQAATSLQIQAKVLVNAAGPWVAQFIEQALQLTPRYGVRMVQGSHIVVPKLYNAENAFILQNADKRIVFAIPYLQRYTLIGTTDREYTGDPAQVSITESEIAYLLDISNQYFKTQLQRQDVLHHYSGVRPLCDEYSDDHANKRPESRPENPAKVSRDYTLHLQHSADQAPLLSVFGGKLTTYRKLAEAAVDSLKAIFSQLKPSWTAQQPLPGAENWIGLHHLQRAIQQQIPSVDDALAMRWAKAYGTRVWLMLGEAKNLDELGMYFGAGLYAQEIYYLYVHEWAQTSDDILYRRTKLGLMMTMDQQQVVSDYLRQRDERHRELAIEVA